MLPTEQTPYNMNIYMLYSTQQKNSIIKAQKFYFTVENKLDYWHSEVSENMAVFTLSEKKCFCFNVESD